MNLPHKQRGLTLIILVFIIGLAATGYLLYALNPATAKIERDKKTSIALAEAKDALIGYAVSYDDTHSGEVYGYLPCSDISATDPNGEGSQSICGSQNVSILGKFPWKTLDIAPVKDGDGECLWYAVSGTSKNNPKTSAFSPETLGLIAVLSEDGLSYLANPADPAVAVVFSPGALLGGQDRSDVSGASQCGGNYIAQNYLDIDVVTGVNNASISLVANEISTFIAAKNSATTVTENDSFNDKLLIIKRSDVFAGYCKKYKNKLLSFVSDIVNNCDDPANPGSPRATCALAGSSLINYCEPLSCREAAQSIISPSCLSDLPSPACQTAIQNLKGCSYV